MRSILYLAVAATIFCSAHAAAGPISVPVTDTNGSSPGDIKRYDVVGPGMLGPAAAATTNAALLAGNLVSPGGHIELFGSSESVDNATYDASTDRTSLRGTLAGNPIVLSSLTAADWAMTVGPGDTLIRRWLLDGAVAHGVDLLTPILGSLVPLDLAEAAFVDAGGRQRFADPNISYVNRDDSTGDVTIGLSGYYNAYDELFALLSSAGFAGSIVAAMLPTDIQISELVKVEYLGNTFFMYGFMATATGLTAGDTYDSGSGLYELVIDGTTGMPTGGGGQVITTETVSEPGTLAVLFLGMLGLGIVRRKSA